MPSEYRLYSAFLKYLSLEFKYFKEDEKIQFSPQVEISKFLEGFF